MLTKEEIQDRIENEIIVDCYDEYEMSMGWYTYMQDSLGFPFKATAALKKTDGSTEKKEVKIIALASDEGAFLTKDFDLEMEHGAYLQKIEYSKLSDIKASAQTLEALEAWDAWVGK